MNMIVMDRDEVIKQIVQNIIEAGAAKQEDCNKLTQHLQHLNAKGLVVALLDSHNLKEEANEHTDFYPLDVDAISKN